MCLNNKTDDILAHAWKQKSTPNTKNCTHLDESFSGTHLEVLEFTNVGNTPAFNIEITTISINAKKYFEQYNNPSLLDYDTNSYNGCISNNIEFGPYEQNENIQLAYSTGDYGMDTHRLFASENKNSQRHHTIPPSTSFTLSISKSDLAVFNHYLYVYLSPFHTYVPSPPKIEICFRYEDRHQNHFEDNFILEISPKSYLQTIVDEDYFISYKGELKYKYSPNYSIQ